MELYVFDPIYSVTITILVYNTILYLQMILLSENYKLTSYLDLIFGSSDMKKK